MLKSVVLVRTDLKMSKGKIASQTGHAFVYAYLLSEKTCIKWLKAEMPKIVLKVSSEEELEKYANILYDNGILVMKVVYQGRTQIAPHTTTCLAIEIVDSDILDKYLGELKLL